ALFAAPETESGADVVDVRWLEQHSHHHEDRARHDVVDRRRRLKEHRGSLPRLCGAPNQKKKSLVGRLRGLTGRSGVDRSIAPRGIPPGVANESCLITI